MVCRAHARDWQRARARRPRLGRNAQLRQTHSTHSDTKARRAEAARRYREKPDERALRLGPRLNSARRGQRDTERASGVQGHQNLRKTCLQRRLAGPHAADVDGVVASATGVRSPIASRCYHEQPVSCVAAPHSTAARSSASQRGAWHGGLEDCCVRAVRQGGDGRDRQVSGARGCGAAGAGTAHRSPQEEFLGEGLDATVLEELRVVRGAAHGAAP